MKKIILDTNFLMIPYTFRVNIFAELSRIMDDSYKLFIIDKTVDELENIIKNQPGKHKQAAQLALQLIAKKKFSLINTIHSSKDVDGKYILFVYEKEFNEKENENFLACLELNGIENEPYILAKGRDFYADPAFSDGKVAWLEWDHPDMPWDSTELKIADFNGKLSDIKSVAGGKGIAICQPTFKNGKLYFVMDKTGKPEDDPENWWNIYVYDGSITAVTKELAEYGVPHWVFGQKRFDFIGEKLVTIRSKDGEDKIFCDTEITLPFDNFDDLVVGEKLYCTASQSGRGRALIAFDLKGDMEVIKRNTSLQMQAQDISAAKWIAYPTRDGKKSYAYLNLPKNSKYMASDEKPPLLVLAHGGPTSATSSAFSFVKQFWTSSGYAILDVDYRGSTGYGRAYRDALLAKWGLIDSDDVADGVQYLVKEGLVDSSRVAIRGGSAGGYMVQRQLTRFPDLFAVGASYFGIGNLITLVEETHKFESQYIDNLVGGKLPEAKKEYTARSPINHLNKLKAPMIIFQGSDDKIVTPENSREMAKILKEKGILHEYHEYPEEAHGFRKKENNVDSLNKEAEFYKKVFIRNVA